MIGRGVNTSHKTIKVITITGTFKDIYTVIILLNKELITWMDLKI